MTDFSGETQRPLHILLCVHRFYPEHFFGTEAYTRAIARQFIASGHRVTVLTAREPGEPAQARLVDVYEVDGIRVLRIDRNQYPNRNAADGYAPVSLTPVYADLLRRLAPDIVHVCHLANLGTPLLDVASRLGIPTFATLTDFFNLCLTGSLETADGKLCAGPNRRRDNCMSCGLRLRADEAPTLWWRALAQPTLRPLFATAATRLLPLLPPPLSTDARAVVDRPDALLRAMRHCRAAVAPTRVLARKFQENGCDTPIEIRHFGIDIDRSLKPERRDGPLRIGFIGQITYQKGPHILLQALLPLSAERYELVIWGAEAQSPRYSADLRDVASRMPVTFRGTFAEPQAAAVLSEIDVLVLPSTWHENSPLTMLKALATHTPVIVSDVEGMTEFVNDGENGFVFPRGDVEALSHILNRLMINRDLLREVTQRTEYTPTERDMAADLLALYARHGAAAPR